MLNRSSVALACVAALSAAAASPAHAADVAPPATAQAAATQPATAQAAASETPPTADAASWALATKRHQGKCVPDDALTVRLVLKQHAVAAKVAFWLDDQRVGTASGSQLYGAHVKTHRVVRPQTFTNLPAGPMQLKVIVRTRGGASYLIRRTYYHCTPPVLGRKSISVR